MAARFTTPAKNGLWVCSPIGSSASFSDGVRGPSALGFSALRGVASSFQMRAGSVLDVVVLRSVFQMANGIVREAAQVSRRCLRRALAPTAGEVGPVRGLLVDLTRSKQEL